MKQAAGSSPTPSLDEFIERYEAGLQHDGQANLADFLPDRDHPLYLFVLCELVRVDLEYSWQRGQPTQLEQYQRRFPELFRDPGSLHEIIFEECRLRSQAGAVPTDSEYLGRFGVSPVLNGAALLDGTGARPVVELGSGRTDPSEPDACREAVEIADAAWSYRAFRRSNSGTGLESWLLTLSKGSNYVRLFQDLYRADPAAADRLAQAVTQFPVPGEDFLGFQLLAELGCGAFGKVYLAHQGDLADRLVVVKVSPELFGEWRTVAQLQHTHIVPIYSRHRCSPFQAVCMPYLGGATLADVLQWLRRLPAPPSSGKVLADAIAARHERLGLWSAPASAALAKQLHEHTYVAAILALAADLADGLGHAHERGILHRNLKPANVLLTDDGRPLLLDFNLSEDTKLRRSPSAALIGGTLPYLAPEHLDAFDSGTRPVDARSDLYSLGIMLYELLAGRHPFETQGGPLSVVLPQMIAERRQPPSPLPCRGQITPAVAAIVRRCLEPEPSRRYQTMGQLAEDLRRWRNA